MGREAAERRARALRAESFRIVAASGRFPPELELNDIRRDAEAGFYQWTGRRVLWPWPEIAKHYRQNYPDRFEISVWWRDTLCGLGIGKPARSRRHLSVEFIEAAPFPDQPLKGPLVLIVLGAADEYAALLGCKYPRLSNPLPPLIPLYESLGFRLASAVG